MCENLVSIVVLQTQSYYITGLAPYQLVTVTITATNGGGTSGSSNEITGRAGETGNSHHMVYTVAVYIAHCNR